MEDKKTTESVVLPNAGSVEIATPAHPVKMESENVEDNTVCSSNGNTGHIDESVGTVTRSPPLDKIDKHNEDVEEISDDVLEERLRGDAIGDTVYSQRFVASTLLQLAEKDVIDVEEEESLVEDTLCTLWDMTAEKDVAEYILNIDDSLPIIMGRIETSQSKRIVEILVGTLGNILDVRKGYDLLINDESAMKVLLDLTACSDSLTLVQLMRLYTVLMAKVADNQTDAIKWFKYFSEHDSFLKNMIFILENSRNVALLDGTLMALNAILVQCALATENQLSTDVPHFDEVFINKELIVAVTEAMKWIKNLNGKKRKGQNKFDSDDDDDNKDYDHDDEDEEQKMAQNARVGFMFVNIHSILVQYESSYAVYKPHIKYILNNLGALIKSSRFCEAKPVVGDYMVHIFKLLGQPFLPKLFIAIVEAWVKADGNVATIVKHSLKKNSSAADAEEINDCDDELSEYEFSEDDLSESEHSVEEDNDDCNEPQSSNTNDLKDCYNEAETKGDKSDGKDSDDDDNADDILEWNDDEFNDKYELYLDSVFSDYNLTDLKRDGDFVELLRRCQNLFKMIVPSIVHSKPKQLSLSVAKLKTPAVDRLLYALSIINERTRQLVSNSLSNIA